MNTNFSRRLRAFTLVEMMVVVGLIAFLIAMLMPALTRSRQQAQTVVCKSNLHQIGLEMTIYANTYKGWLFPVWNYNPGPHSPINEYVTLGTNWAPNHRWPVFFFSYTHPDPDSLPYSAWNGTYDPPTSWTLPAAPNYDADPPTTPTDFDAAQWTPKIMLCPSDLDAFEAHSYILNKHLAQSPQQLVRAFNSTRSTASGRVIVMGEKVTKERDYYMEVHYLADKSVDSDEFNKKVELYRHGTKFGSNYLYNDWSVDNIPPGDVLGQVDPWAINVVPPGP